MKPKRQLHDPGPVATGSDVSPVFDAHRQLAGQGIRSRVASMPSWELFET